MKPDIVEHFREWGVKQYNNDGKLFEKKSIDNYHSSLNTILEKLNMVEYSGYSKIYDCDDAERFEVLYFEIFGHPDFVECNNKSNHTHSSALNLYRRFVRYLEAANSAPIVKDELEIQERLEKDKARALSDKELEEKIRKKKKGISKERKVVSTNYSRDPEIAEYAIRRAAGKCDLCLSDAPFEKKDGTPYLESHHVDWLSRGGEDVIENVVAVCPNCHRRIHVLDEKADNSRLKKRLCVYSRRLKKMER